MNFAEKFCARRQLPAAQYVETVLRLTLRPRARWLRPLLDLNPHYFAADREFIRSVGRLTQTDRFSDEAMEFVMDPAGKGFLHRTLKLRISRRRLHNLLRETLRD